MQSMKSGILLLGGAFLCAVGGWCLSGSAQAHHAFATEFDVPAKVGMSLAPSCAIR